MRRRTEKVGKICSIICRECTETCTYAQVHISFYAVSYRYTSIRTAAWVKRKHDASKHM